MMMQALSTSEQRANLREDFMDRILRSIFGVFDVFSMHLGDRLGYYRALAKAGPTTPAELATLTNTNERYVREWLEHQASAGILEVEDPAAAPEARRFALSEPHAEVLTDVDNLDYVPPLLSLLVATTRPVQELVTAYRSGDGVPDAAYGPTALEGQAGVNRNAFLQLLGSKWLPGIPDVHTRLTREPPARVADVGCGVAWSSIGIAKAYPKVHVDGFDLDEAAVELALRNVEQAGLSDRVKVEVRDAADRTLRGRYDLVCAFECVHDFSRPAEALGVMRNLAAEDGTVLVVDERVGESFLGDDGDVDWMMYGWSTLSCLPSSMNTKGSAATGTVMRPSKLLEYAEAAGFDRVEILPIESFNFRFYRLHPSGGRE